jgi:hypothetical protein
MHTTQVAYIGDSRAVKQSQGMQLTLEAHIGDSIAIEPKA